jgi:hypothetical protein
MALVLCVIFLRSVARFYHPGFGFTALIGFPAGHEYEAPQMAAIAHWDYPGWASYDGQFYAQRAFDPFLRDPRVDRAMDLAPYRARRMLFSLTAYVFGLGKPAWVLEAFALQNVACWLLLAWVLTRWLPVDGWRTLALWTACLFSHGLLWSVRFSLLDGPSLLLTALAILVVDRGHPLWSAALVGVGGVGRETSLIAALSQPIPRDRRGWIQVAVAALLVIAPLLVWQDYLRSIYRSTTFYGSDLLVAPFSAVTWSWSRALRALRLSGVWSSSGLTICLLLSVTVQAIYVVVKRDLRSPWWRVGLGYAALMIVVDRVVFDPGNGALTRVMLPLTVAFNVLLARERRAAFWSWFVAGNLHVIPALWVMPLL